MIKVKQEVEIYEEDDEEIKGLEGKHLTVESHWNWDERVTLVIGRKRYTVLGDDLKTAIDNAMNINRF